MLRLLGRGWAGRHLRLGLVFLSFTYVPLLVLFEEKKEKKKTDSLQNKDKVKKGNLPEDMFAEGRYHAARTVGDEWICYPWEAMDIDEHDRFGKENGDGVTI